MKTLKSKLDDFFNRFTDETDYIDQLDLEGQFADLVERMEDWELGEQLELDEDDANFAIDILTARQWVDAGCCRR